MEVLELIKLSGDDEKQHVYTVGYELHWAGRVVGCRAVLAYLRRSVFRERKRWRGWLRPHRLRSRSGDDTGVVGERRWSAVRAAVVRRAANGGSRRRRRSRSDTPGLRGRRERCRALTPAQIAGCRALRSTSSEARWRATTVFRDRRTCYSLFVSPMRCVQPDAPV